MRRCDAECAEFKRLLDVGELGAPLMLHRVRRDAARFHERDDDDAGVQPQTQGNRS